MGNLSSGSSSSDSTPIASMDVSTGIPPGYEGVGHSRWMEGLASLIPSDGSPAQKGNDPLVGTGKQSVAFNAQSVHLPVAPVLPKINSPAPFSHPNLKSIIVDPSTVRDPKDPLIAVVPSLVKQLGPHALEKLALDYLDVEGGDAEEAQKSDAPDVKMGPTIPNLALDVELGTDDDLQILDTAPTVFQTPGKKKKTLKIREKLDDGFLRRSKRLSSKKMGYKDAASATKAQASQPLAKEVDDNLEPTPLAMILADNFTPAPYLTQDVLQGIGTGFLQIQPESVSAALLEKDDLDE